MPTEEIFTTPDWRRAEGTIRSSRPLALAGDLVEGLQLTVRDGKIVEVHADKGADVVRGQLETDEQAAYFGELALVDGTSRVGQTGITFFDTLYDENATCHIAYGFGVPEVFDGRARRGHERVDGAHRLHGRRARARRRRDHERRRAHPDHPRGRVAATGLSQETRLRRYAELVVRVGANVQPGQLVDVVADIDHARRVARGRARPRTAPARRTSTSATSTRTSGAR